MPILDLAVESIRPDPEQPRREFDEAALGALAASLQSEGLLQPITVRPDGEGYLLVSGERRWRAAKLLGWTTISAILFSKNGAGSVRKAQIVENVVRRDLNPVEEARAYQRCLDDGMSTQEIAEAVGKSAGGITWLVSILRCREDALHLVARCQMTPTAAWHVARLTANGQAKALRRLTSEKLDTEQIVAFCDAIWMQENQVALLQETALTVPQMRARKEFLGLMSAVVRLAEALRRDTNTRALLLPEIVPDQARQAITSIDLVMSDLRWVKSQLTRTEAMQRLNGGG